MMTVNPDYLKPIFEIANELSLMKIPFIINLIFDGAQIHFSWCDGDVICHHGSYGHEVGHVETYCFPWDDGDVTEMTTHDFMKSIIDLYNFKFH